MRVIDANHPSLLELWGLAVAPELAAAPARCVQGVQRGAARLQNVRRVRRELCEALSGAHCGGGAEQRGRELLRPLQTEAGCLRREKFRRGRAVESGIGRPIPQVIGLGGLGRGWAGPQRRHGATAPGAPKRGIRAAAPIRPAATSVVQLLLGPCEDARPRDATGLLAACIALECPRCIAVISADFWP
jgi:hypothetical protein